MPESSKRGHSIFDPTKSKTFTKLNGSTFNITYGDASFAFGDVGIDTVDIGGATVFKQAIGLPKVVSSSFIEDEASDGLVGLGFDRLNSIQPRPQKSFLSNLAANLDEPLLAAQLKKGAPGTYEFGSIDKTKFSGELIKVPVDHSRGFWEFKSTMFKVGNDTQIRKLAKGVPSAVADTGTTLMLLNDEVVVEYYKQVQGSSLSAEAGGYIFPCDATLPNLFVSLADTHFAKISGDLMNFAPVGSSPKTGAKCKTSLHLWAKRFECVSQVLVESMG